MQRCLEDIAGKSFDLVVVGAGIHGICIARDAALRGLSVALLDRGDFGGETSHNSLKLVHRGLRYIQHFDFRRMRQSALECRAWLRVAPHLVRPLQVAMQTYGHTTRGPEALWVASRVHALIGYDRNVGVPNENHIPSGNIVGRAKSDLLIPGMQDSAHNGAACWHDGQMQDADRIMIECLDSAVSAGANVANYVEVSAFLREADRVRGVVATDKLTGDEFDVVGKVTVNTAGPWSDGFRFGGDSKDVRLLDRQPKNLNMNIVVQRSFESHALGVKSVRQSDSRVDDTGRLFFITPWRGVSVVGTTHDAYDGNVDESFIGEESIRAFIDEVNSAYPLAHITPDEVAYCHWGLTPGEKGLTSGEARRARHGRIIDHQKEDSVAGLMSVIGVKWTTARLVAENVVNAAAIYVGGVSRACQTDLAPLPGAVGFAGSRKLESEIGVALSSIVSADAISDLATEYGTRWRQLFSNEANLAELSDVDLFRCKARFAVKREMAVRLSDVLCRRSNLLQRGSLRGRQVMWCLDMMADELNWTDSRKRSELTLFEEQRARNHGKILA